MSLNQGLGFGMCVCVCVYTHAYAHAHACRHYVTVGPHSHCRFSWASLSRPN